MYIFRVNKLRKTYAQIIEKKQSTKLFLPIDILFFL